MALIEFDNYKTQLMTYKTPLEEIRASLDLEGKQQRIIEMERQMEEPTFWDDPEKSAKIMKDLNSLKSAVGRYNSLKTQYEDIETLIEMGREEDDEELAAEAGEALETFAQDIENMRTFRVSTMPIMPRLHFPQAPVVPKRWISMRCSTACIHAGVRSTALLSSFWTTRKATKPVLRA